MTLAQAGSRSLWCYTVIIRCYTTLVVGGGGGGRRIGEFGYYHWEGSGLVVVVLR